MGLGVDPVVVVTRLVAGQPLEYGDCGSLDAADTARVGGELGRFLAHLHAPATLEALRARDIALSVPKPQADTDRIRTGLAPLVDPRRAEQVAAYCDWTDTVLAAPRVHPDVLVHGDLHGHNQVWTTADWTLRLVVDFETAGAAEPEFDFRYLPGQSPTLDLLLATTEVYERETGRSADLARVMAWNVQTVLGDALWRTEAGIGLPGGGTPTQWVDELGQRLRALGFAG